MPHTQQPPTPQQCRDSLRRTLRSTRNALSAAAVSEHSHAIIDRVLPLLGNAHTVAGYLAVGREVNISAIREQLQPAQQFFVPIVKPDNKLLFAPLNDDTRFATGSFGIQEPIINDKDCLEPMALDAVLVPLVGFDSRCNRMGMGGGYYDRNFASRKKTGEKPLLIGVAFDAQEVDSVLPEWWDVPLDYIATESRLLSGLT